MSRYGRRHVIIRSHCTCDGVLQVCRYAGTHQSLPNVNNELRHNVSVSSCTSTLLLFEQEYALRTFYIDWSTFLVLAWQQVGVRAQRSVYHFEGIRSCYSAASATFAFSIEPFRLSLKKKKRIKRRNKIMKIEIEVNRDGYIRDSGSQKLVTYKM